MLKKYVVSLFSVCLLVLSAPAFSKTVHVPNDAATITAAVAIAQNRDTIIVDDGFYFEDNIIIDKKLHIKARTPYRAVIQGSGTPWASIFIIRAPAEIEGFVLKNADYGILQRDSPDVLWTAHDLVIMNMENAAVSINDVEWNVGRGLLFNIIIHNTNCAFNTNDANGMDVKNSFVSNCRYGFRAWNHLYFRVDKIVVSRCRQLYFRDSARINPPATSKIDFGLDIVFLDRITGSREHSLSSLYEGIFRSLAGNPGPEDEKFENLMAFAFNILGEISFQLGDYGQSLKWNNEALVLGEKLGIPEAVWNALFNLGKILEKKEQYFDALAGYDKAVEAIDHVRTELISIRQKSEFMKSKAEVYESLISLLLKLHQRFPADGFDQKAFFMLERAKARAFLDSLHEGQIDFIAQMDEKARSEKQAIKQHISRIQRTLKNPYLSPQKRQALLEQLDLQEGHYESLMIRVKKDHPEFADLALPQPYPYEEVRSHLLDQETVLLEYFLGKDQALAFLATDKGLFCERLTEPRLLRELVQNYQLFLKLDKASAFQGENGSRRLYSLLIKPFQDKIGKNVRKMIIVPSGILHNLPFETLIRGDGDKGRREGRGPRYLIEDYEIAYAASASSLINLKKRPKPEQRQMDLLGVANPKSPTKPSLRFAVKEAKQVAGFFEGRKKTLLLYGRARESRLKALDLRRYKILHFAAHSSIDEQRWWRSSLFLRPDKNLAQDGLLQPQEVYNLRLNADLVVLSSCRSGGGKLEKEEGILGFVKAFLYAGAKSVLSSLWKVDDKAAPAFMGMLFQHLSAGRTVSQALRLAKLEMITTTDYSHPFYWASFIATGDAEAIVSRR